MSAVHISIVVLTVIAVTSRTNTQTIYSGFISLAVGSLFILKMIYQIEYIEQKVYDVNCTVWIGTPYINNGWSSDDQINKLKKIVYTFYRGIQT